MNQTFGERFARSRKLLLKANKLKRRIMPSIEWTDQTWAQGSALVIKITSCRMPSSCWGSYVNINLIEVESDIFVDQRRTPKAPQITARTFSRGKGVICVHYSSERNHLGKTARSGAGRQLQRLILEALEGGRVPHIISCRPALALAVHLFRHTVVVSEGDCVVVEHARIGVESCDDAILLKMSGRAKELFYGEGRHA